MKMRKNQKNNINKIKIILKCMYSANFQMLRTGGLLTGLFAISFANKCRTIGLCSERLLLASFFDHFPAVSTSSHYCFFTNHFLKSWPAGPPHSYLLFIFIILLFFYWFLWSLPLLFHDHSLLSPSDHFLLLLFNHYHSPPTLPWSLSSPLDHLLLHPLPYFSFLWSLSSSPSPSDHFPFF